jgi:hypothetical protein
MLLALRRPNGGPGGVGCSVAELLLIGLLGLALRAEPSRTF